MSVPARRALFCVVVLLGTVGVALHAQAPPAPADAPPETQAVLASDQAPADLMVWNRRLAVFRASLRSSTAQQRAAAPTARIEAALERLAPEDVRYSVIQAGGDRGAMILGGAEALFAILDRDLPQDTATTLDRAGAQVVNRLQTVLRERTEQRRWPVLIRSIVEAVIAAVALLGCMLVSRSALEWLLHWLATRAAALITRAIAGAVSAWFRAIERGDLTIPGSTRWPPSPRAVSL